MKTPTWAIVIGIFMLLIGGCGAIQRAQLLANPDQIKEAQEAMDEAVEDIRAEAADSSRIIEGDTTYVHGSMDSADLRVMEMASGILQFSEYRIDWMFRFARYGLIFSTIYILAALLLIMRRRVAIPAVYIALVLSIGFSIYQIIIFSNDPEQGMLSYISSGQLALTAFLSLIFIVVVATSDKTVYLPPEPDELQ